MLDQEFLYYVELVIWYLKLLVVLTLVVIGLVIRQKWKNAVAREAEIRRLMILAAEEAARAELEVEAVGYYAYDDVPLSRDVIGCGSDEVVADVGEPKVSGKGENAEVGTSGIKVFHCEVCLTPTTTKCARCKSVRYCSAKCQIFHWRRGHKDECRPPDFVNQTSESKIYPSIKVVKQGKNETPSMSYEPENRHVKHYHTQLEGKVFRGVGQTKELRGNNDDIQEVKSSDSTASFGTSFSSESSFSVFSDSSDDASTSPNSSDGPSTSSSSGSSDHEKYIVRRNGDTSNQATIARRYGETKPCDEKNSDTVPSNVNLTQPISNQRENQRSLYPTMGSDAKVSFRLAAKSGVSDFWEGALDYKWAEFIQPESHVTNDHLTSIGFSLHRTSASFRKTETNPHVDGEIHCYKDSVFKEIDVVSMKSPIQSSSLRSRQARDEDNSVSSVSLTKPVRYSSSDAIIPPQNGKSKSETEKVSNSRLSSSKADRTSNGTSFSPIAKPRSSSASNEDRTVYSVKRENACQANRVIHSQNVTRSSMVTERLYSNELDSTAQPRKSRLAGSVPSNYSERSVDHGRNVASSVARVDAVKSNFSVATSNKSYSLKAVESLKSSTWKAVEHFKASKLSRDCAAHEIRDHKGMFSFELFRSLYGWNTVELQPCGLVNCGNSCYANAVLQCLSFTPPLTAYLLQGLHSNSCTKRDWCFTCEFENLIHKAKDGNSPISPIRIISQLSNIGSHLSNGREEDAHEFLRYVVDTMQSICVKEAGSNVAGAVEEDTTFLGLTFGGYLESKIRCMKCGNKSERSERSMDLTVEIEGSIQNLEGALDHFTRSETLDAENKYNCSRCKSYQKAKKKLTVLEAPNILTIALKRFQAGKFGKLNKWIDFPEVLDMSPYMSRKSDDKAPVYKLYGVIVHLDTMNAAFSGHYVCYVKNIQNKWFKMDDSVVKSVDLGKVKEQSAYMLLYARCSPKAPKSLRDKFVCESKSKSTLPSPGNRVTSSEAHCNNMQYVKFDTDSYSDSSSLFSSGSDEYSCSTDSSSAMESNSADDLSDLIFGDSERLLRYSWATSSLGSDSSSPSASPVYSWHHLVSPIRHLKRQCNRGIPFLCSDPSSHCSYVDSCSKNSNLRHPETDEYRKVRYIV